MEKIVSGYPLKRFKNAPHEHMKKRQRSMLLFKLDTSHASMGLLLPRSGSRLNKSQLPDESLKDSELLWDLHFQLALFFIVFRASFFIFFSEKKTGFILAHEFPLLKGGIETKVAGFGDCYLYIIFRCAAPWDRGCTDSKRRRGAPGDSYCGSYLERDKKIQVHLFF